MRTGRELILATRPFAVEVRWKSRAYALSTLALLIVFSAGTFWNVHPAARILSSILSALLLVKMFVIYHDHQHHSILHKSVPARILFTGFGLYILAPSSIWKRSHDYHHSHNSKLFSASIGSYPIYTRQKFLNASASERLSYLAVRHPLTIAFAYVTVFRYGMCIQSFRSSPRRHYDSLIALALHSACAASVAVFFGWQTLLLAIVIPFWIACAMGAYLFYAQHNFPAVTFKGNIEWSYEHAALESSSYLVMGPFWRWVTANIGYHHIHHINSRIPFYRLPEAMANIPEFQQARTTTLAPRDIFRCLRLKVWDPGANRMISLSEVWKPGRIPGLSHSPRSRVVRE
jgi:omega-6 fatty acid desaturase (delta-12 desaturase)